MPEFADLSEYRYHPEAVVRMRAKNVGWLGANVSFETAEPTTDFLELLWQHCRFAVLQTRGLHDCHLCTPRTSNTAERNGQRLVLGSAEIRVFAPTGEIYAAPNLIYHYVSVHKYRPPHAFVAAVKEGVRPSSKEYFARLIDMNLTWREMPVPGEHLV